MTVTTNEHGQQNIFAKEPTMTFDEKYTENHNEKAERLNGRLSQCLVYCRYRCLSRYRRDHSRHLVIYR